MVTQGPERVRDVPGAWRQAPSIVRVGDPLSKAVEALLASPNGRAVYVLDADGKLKGVISFRTLLRITTARYAVTSGLFSFIKYVRDVLPERVEDVMRPATPVRMVTLLRDALETLEETKQNDLPIVDNDGNLVCELNGLQLLEVALTTIKGGEEALTKSRADRGHSAGP
jgi:CBS-domain-containing membrane protein